MATTSVAPNRRERRVLETRRAIVESARELFEENGYTETTVDQIAELADVAPRTFFRYFPNKEMLLFADFDEVRSAMLDRLEAAPEGEDPLVSLGRELRVMAAEVAARRDDLVWGFRMCVDQELTGLYERTQVKEQTYLRIASFIAERLGTDPETDPRPLTWAITVMAVFGNALKSRIQEADSSAATSIETFEALLASTSGALAAVAAVTHPPS
jgi:AcrR family transcriptional regulator